MEVDNKALGEGYTKTAKGWYKNDKGKIFVSKEKQWKLATGLHQATQMGREALWNFIKPVCWKRIKNCLTKSCKSCRVHAKVNPEGEL